MLGNDLRAHISSTKFSAKSHMERDDKFFENVTKFKHLGTTLTNENCMLKGI